MKNLQTITKMYRHQLDEIRQKIQELKDQREQLIEYQSQMGEEMKKELSFLSMNPEFGSVSFEGFREGMHEKERNIEECLISIDQQVEKYDEEVMLLYIETKKCEELIATHAREGRKELSKAEQAVLDEVALGKYILSNENG